MLAPAALLGPLREHAPTLILSVESFVELDAIADQRARCEIHSRSAEAWPTLSMPYR